jgi:hypothetical protein
MTGTWRFGPIVAFALGACDGVVQEPIGPTFGAVLRASNEVVPPAGATGSATASLTVRGKVIAYGISATNLSGAANGALHLGAPQTDGPLIVRDLFVRDATTPASRARNAFGAADIQAATPGGTPMSIDDLIAQMRAGNVYVELVTERNPAGEVRGQLALTAEAPSQ